MRASPILLILGLAAMHAPAQPQPLDTTGSTAPAPKVAVPREGCVTAECHPGIKDRPHLHGPVHVNACDSCHTATDLETHAFELVRSREEMCTLCHTVEVQPDFMLHDPFAQGECLSCHDPHGSNESAMLRGENYADSCNACHDDVTGGHMVVHGPASAGACGACHQPHAARLPNLLMVSGRELCLRCHVTTGYAMDSLPVVHEPVFGDCLVCHNPHATDSPAILNAEPVRLCTSCHEGIAHTLETAATQHAAVTTERSCLNCHTAHAANHAALLQMDSEALCFECHDKTITLDDGTTLTNMKALIESNKSLHGAIAQDSCVVCHEIHGGGHRRLLTNEYPSDLYYPFDENAYALCFSCHDRELVLLSRTQHVTSFRNGDQNLHYVHVNRDEKGRSCRVCHDAHAADAERHIRDTVPFGPAEWPLPINYQRTEDGGSCGPGCHQAFEYSRTEPRVYPAMDEDEAWRGTDLVPGVPAEPPQNRNRRR